MNRSSRNYDLGTKTKTEIHEKFKIDYIVEEIFTYIKNFDGVSEDTMSAYKLTK